ncbi:MAG: right-handed parallel beta-helix repeat-containing protein [Candidatus Bathyarchaeota archaeon]|nr:right-handed parallel beta-helix repeat-containing protein [Candidatus Bathyarchaeota archaeon]
MIKEDGTIVGTDHIMRQGNSYTFTGDVIITDQWCSSGLQVLKDDIVIDGNKHALTMVGEGHTGVELTDRIGVTVKNLQILGFNRAILLDNASENSIENNTLIGGGKSTSCGIWFSLSSRNTISRNSITTFTNYSGPADLNYGILIQAASTNNTIDANKVENCQCGIAVNYCADNTLTNNQMANNLQSFGLSYNTHEQFRQNIDSSNTIDDKPIIYWLNEHGKTVPPNAGFVALGNCTNITMQNLAITHNFDSITLINTNDSKIEGSQVANCGNGIFLKYSQNITVSENKLTRNQYAGIGMVDCSDIVVSENDIDSCGYGLTPSGITQNHSGGDGSRQLLIRKNNFTNNDSGMYFAVSRNSTITQNLFRENYFGVNLVQSSDNSFTKNTFADNKGAALRISDAFNNTLFHNNFANNTLESHVLTRWYAPAEYESNVWDNGAEGNYWDNFHSRYSNSSQTQRNVWDTSFYIDDANIDHYPLIKQVNAASPDTAPVGGDIQFLGAIVVAITIPTVLLLLIFFLKRRKSITA